MKILPILLMTFCCALVTFSQNEERIVCPALDIVGPDERTKAGDPITFTLKIDTFGRTYQLKYFWEAEKYTLSPGKGERIANFTGQGTPRISLFQIEEGVTVSLTIGGLPGGICQEVIWESALTAASPRGGKKPFCPTIEVSGPAGVPAPGDTILFSAHVETGGEEIPIKYIWSISSGEILSGQGTTEISVKIGEQDVTATVEVKGLPKDCPNVESSSFSCGLRPPATRTIGYIYR